MTDNVVQVRATTALLLILTTEPNLPECEWTVYRGLGLEGAILEPDGDPLFAVQRWAQKFGTEVQRDDVNRLWYTSGTYTRTHVRIFATY